MSPDTELSMPARLGLLVFLWAVLAAITWLTVGRVLPHFLGWPCIGWVLIVFIVLGFISLYVGAIKMSTRVLSGSYPADRAER